MSRIGTPANHTRRTRADVESSSYDSVISDQHLFVYGTLQEGDVRWHLLSPFVDGDGWPDTVPGRLYDTGLDYPSAVFGDGGTVAGRTYMLLESSLGRCLAVLDEVEDVAQQLYRRIEVTTNQGVRAWAYENGRGLVLTPIPSGDWNHR